ncbi:TIGR02301 family protein [Flexibacterium corallicola]|uniref:TIGR02301 family protein n=1 Tax=Flexibacterium corallicola TaxID=3037259 RepID=UPI00286F19EC|nr:TIGR02301 family protein [Pseudovibrio sp. M1P-2-3]
MGQKRLISVLIGCTFLFVANSQNLSFGQTPEPAQQEQQKDRSQQEAEELRLQSPPYEKQVMRLAEIMGGLHYLRPLCGHDEKYEWSGRMQAFLDSEVNNELRRRRFVERFNQGYRGFSSVYRRCTASAQESSRRYASEGVRITQDVIVKYSRD